MGWSSGTEVMSAVIKSTRAAGVTKDKRKEIYRPIVEAMRDMDWDTLDECVGLDPAYDELFKEIYEEDEW